MKVVFFGTPEFAADVLQYLLQHNVEVCAVVTRPDQPKGRSKTPVPSAVKLFAIEQQLPVYQPERCSTPQFEQILAQYAADLFVVVAYGEILKEHILALPKVACINVHASLLPKFRGAAPIQRAIMEGEKESGVSIMHMVKKMDAGAVLAMASTPITEEMTAGELELQLRKIGSKALFEVISAMEQGPVPAQEQDETQVTFAPKIELEDCQIDWTSSAEQLHNLVRGSNPTPGAWCYAAIRGQQKRLKIWRTKIGNTSTGIPGSIIQFDVQNGITVQCGQGSLHILELQPEGKNPMPAQAFVRGLSPEQFALHLSKEAS